MQSRMRATAWKGMRVGSLIVVAALWTLAWSAHAAFPLYPTERTFGGDTIAMLDIDGDGDDDLVLAGGVVKLGDGSGPFETFFEPPVDPTFVEYFAVVADIDGDTHVDYVAGSLIGNQIRAALGDGDGTFGPFVAFTATLPPRDGAIGDLNGDTIPDLVTTNTGGGISGVNVFLGNGDGSFQPPLSFSAGLSADQIATTVAVGLIDGDALLDVVTGGVGAFPDYGDIYLLRGNGDGTLQAAVTLASGLQYELIALGDIGGDASLDLVSVSSGNGARTELRLGNGDGTFQPPPDMYNGGDVLGLAVGDVNADLLPDVAVAFASNFGSSPPASYRVFLSNGDGTLQAPITHGLDYRPGSIAIGSADDDGVPDLVSTEVLLGNGDGSFRHVTNDALLHDVGETASVAVSGHVDGDAHLDLAVRATQAADTSDGVVLLGNGDGSFQAPVPFEGGASAEPFIELAHLDAGPVPDLVMLASDGVVTLLGNGDGTFQAPIHSSAGAGKSPTTAVVVETNGDAFLDVLTVNASTGDTSVLLGNGDGTFSSTGIFRSVSSTAGSVAAGDVDGDLDADLIIANDVSCNPSCNAVTLLRSHGNGFHHPAEYVIFDVPNIQDVALADLDGDTILDVAMVEADPFSSGGVHIALGNGDGSFQDPIEYGPTYDASALAIADVTSDGRLDILTANRAGNEVRLHRGNGDGSFEPAVLYRATEVPTDVLAADVDGDLALDAVAVGTASGEIAVLIAQPFASLPVLGAVGLVVLVVALVAAASGRPSAS